MTSKRLPARIVCTVSVSWVVFIRAVWYCRYSIVRSRYFYWYDIPRYIVTLAILLSTISIEVWWVYSTTLFSIWIHCWTVAPERIWKWRGGTRRAWSAGKFFVVSLHFFGITNTISRFGERFCDCQYILVSLLLYFYTRSRCPRARPFVKMWRGHVLPVPYGVGATVVEYCFIVLFVYNLRKLFVIFF